MLLTAGDRQSGRQLNRLQQLLADHDPTDEIGAAWGIKERLRMLLAGSADPAEILAALATFYQACADAEMPEAETLATTIRAWWPISRSS